MQVSVESPDTINRVVTVTIPSDEVSKVYKSSFKKCAQTARIDGFRKGHIPTKIILTHYGHSIQADTIDQLIQANYGKAVVESKFEFVGTPSVELVKDAEFAEDKDFTFKIKGEVIPTIELKPYTELNLKKYVSEVKEEDINRLVETLRQQRATFEDAPEDKEVANDDKITIDFLGRCDGVEFEGGKAEGFELHMGKGSMIPGFEEQILGHKKGDSFTISVKFPDEYHAENLKGKDAEFDIKVQNIKVTKLPELNEDFYKAFGIENGDAEKFRADLKKNMERELMFALDGKNRDQVIDRLAEVYSDIAYPEALFKDNISYQASKVQRQFRQMGIRDENFLAKLVSDTSRFEEPAKKNSIARVVIHNIINSENVPEPTDEEIKAEIRVIADAYEDSDEVFKQVQKDKQQLESIKMVLQERKLFDHILSLANAASEEISFKDLVESKQGMGL